MKFKFEQLANQILNEGIGDPEAAASVARDHNRSLNAPSRYDDAPSRDEIAKRKEQARGLEGEDRKMAQANKMFWTVYKKTADGWAPLKNKEGRSMGAMGYEKAQSMLFRIKEKDFNKGKEFLLKNNDGQTFNQFFFSRE